jgi:hypothetical protein
MRGTSQDVRGLVAAVRGNDRRLPPPSTEGPGDSLMIIALRGIWRFIEMISLWQLWL